MFLFYFSCLTNFPSESKKCPGLKVSGVCHTVLSNITEAKFVIIAVPFGRKCPPSVVSLLAVLGIF
uniref:Uncharacterized protein n=1 Tax=Anguilla anguilla TaxID=7936 RepID=A0A0E9QZ45_ANGAN